MSQSSCVRVLLIDKKDVLRMMIEEYLQTHPRISLVQSVATVEEAVKMATCDTPDVVVLGLQDNVRNQVERLRAALPQARIVWLGWLEWNGTEALEQLVGTDEFVNKEQLPDNLIQKILNLAQKDCT